MEELPIGEIEAKNLVSNDEAQHKTVGIQVLWTRRHPQIVDNFLDQGTQWKLQAENHR